MADLLTLVRKDTKVSRVAGTKGGEYAGPCPFCGGDDRFRCWPDHPDGGGQWWCRQCDRGGDVIAYRVERGGITPQEAGRLRRKDDNGRQSAHRATHSRERRENSQKPALRPSSGAERPTWDPDVALRALEACEAALWSKAGERARAWLAERGLSDETIKRWRLGYHEERGEIEGIWTPRGVTIPGIVDDEIRYIKVRRPVPPLDGPKYQCAKGSKVSMFGLDRLTGKGVAVICEGEFDAMLLHQEAGDLVDVVAIGSKTATPSVRELNRLTSASRWLLVLDNDADERANEWAEWSARVRRVRPLDGNDLTDLHQAGGDLRAWIEHHLERRGRPALEAEAARILAGDMASPGARKRYADIAQRLGWPCWGTTWPEWAREDRVAAVDEQLAEQAAEIVDAEQRVVQLEMDHGIA